MSSPINRKVQRYNMQQRRLSTAKLTLAAMLACLALIFTYIEFLMPISLGIPGIKLGLANIVIIIALYGLNWKYALSINLLRIFMAGLLFSGAFGIIYSLAGATASFIAMVFLKKTDKFSIVGVSMGGGVFHNFGQIALAAQLVSNSKIFYYFPVLLFAGLVTGITMGFFAYYLSIKMPKHLFPELRQNIYKSTNFASADEIRDSAHQFVDES